MVLRRIRPVIVTLSKPWIKTTQAWTSTYTTITGWKGKYNKPQYATRTSSSYATYNLPITDAPIEKRAEATDAAHADEV